MSIDTTSTSRHLDDDELHDKADAFVAGMDRTERVAWLQWQSYSDREILDALLNKDDPDLDEFTREAAHSIASEVNNATPTQVPAWLR